MPTDPGTRIKHRVLLFGYDLRNYQPRVGGGRRTVRLLPHDRDHWRGNNTLCTLRGAVPAGLAEFGQPKRPVGVHSPGHVAATDDQAIEEFWPHYETAFAEAARVRGFRPPTMQSFLRDIGPGAQEFFGQSLAAVIRVW